MLNMNPDVKSNTAKVVCNCSVLIFAYSAAGQHANISAAACRGFSLASRCCSRYISASMGVAPPLPHRARFRLLLPLVAMALLSAPLAFAESPAPSVHWGAIAFPDQDRTLDLVGLTVNRFTEFDGDGRRYNNITETAGFNFVSLSWTEKISRFPGWNLNLTGGGGPTADGFTRFLQNDVIHRFRGLTPVPVDQKREAIDFMVSGSLNRWMNWFGDRQQGFAGFGVGVGTLYYEPWLNIGVRRLALSDLGKTLWGSSRGLETISDWVRFSVMGRYSRVFQSAAFKQMATVNYLGQAAISFADFRDDIAHPPRWELEIAFTVDSGLFVDYMGKSLEERFVSVALHMPYVTFETWNDLINQKDYGPTFGARFILDLREIYYALKGKPIS